MNLTDQELNEWVAKEIMGWRLHLGDWQYPHSESKTGWFKIYNRYKFNPTKNLNHTYLMEEKIREIGKEEEWTVRLYDLLNPKRVRGFAAFNGIHASARQRCEAAYLCFNNQSQAIQYTQEDPKFR